MRPGVIETRIEKVEGNVITFGNGMTYKIKEYDMIEKLIGATVVAVEGGVKGDDYLEVFFDNGWAYRQIHYLNCCERVEVEDINPSLETIVGGVLHSIVREDETKLEGNNEWTFYKIHTSKGSVDIRWVGDTDSHYSTSITEEVRPPVGRWVKAR